MTSHRNKYKPSVGLLFFLFINAIYAENTCTDSQATCINIRRCPHIIEIAREQKPLPPETVETIRKLRCGTEGNDPMVCCISQNTTSLLPMITELLSDAGNNIPDLPDVTGHPNLRLLDHQACGPFIPQNFLGTTKTRIFDYPWMVLLEYEVKIRNTSVINNNNKYRCGGAIISNRYILTAAHCITNLFRVIAVRIGARNINKERDCDIDLDGHEVQCSEKYQDFGIESIHPHPEFSRTSMQNDIGLIRLNDTIDFSPFSVKPICLPFGGAAILNQRTATVTGWGQKRSNWNNISPNLLHAKLPLVSNDKCKEIYKNLTEIWYKQICAGGLTMDSCGADGGGPLQAPGIYNGTVRTIQYGIVSFGTRPCSIVGFPGVYTKVSYYMDWILDTMRD